MGDSTVKAGRVLDVNEPLTGMSGRYMIMTAKHTVSNQIHTMDLELVLPEEVK
ncbi:XkdQ/YqbQ family protein [Cryptosporangium minutisporangium]